MARVISFFPKAVYMGSGSGSLANLSEIFEITEEGQIDLEWRFYGIQGGVTVTGSLETTSDPRFVDSAWKQITNSSFTRSSTGITIATGLSGLGRFVRAKLEVPSTGTTCAYVNGVARKL